MTKRSSPERATWRDPLGSAVFPKSRFARYLASFLEATNRQRRVVGAVPPASARVMERGFDRVEQRADAERHVVDAAVDEKARCAPHAALQAAVDMLTHALQVHVIVHLCRVQRHVEAELFRVLMQLPGLQVLLVREQQLVHLPEL